MRVAPHPQWRETNYGGVVLDINVLKLIVRKDHSWTLAIFAQPAYDQPPEQNRKAAQRAAVAAAREFARVLGDRLADVAMDLDP